ncbi:hypothetical protein D7X48_18150 [bacterium D16-50]|nr:hypothetical protein D7X48_18150 [bacterium D16-50]
MKKKVRKKAGKADKITQYRKNYIFTLLQDGNREAVDFLEKAAAHHGVLLDDVCVIYNILQLANVKSKLNYPVDKILGVMDIILTSADSSKVYSVELVKRVVPNLFRVGLLRWELDGCEKSARVRIQK